MLYTANMKLQNNYSFPVDMWSMGIVLYQMLFRGQHPIPFDVKKKGYLEYMALL